MNELGGLGHVARRQRGGGLDGSVNRLLDADQLVLRRTAQHPTDDFALAAGAKVVLHTGEGDDDIENLFWDRSTSIWNNSGDLAVLLDPEGNMVSQYPEDEA